MERQPDPPGTIRKRIRSMILTILAIGIIWPIIGMSVEQAKAEIWKKPAFSLSGFGEASYRDTNFYLEDHQTVNGFVDLRGEFWLPPGRGVFSWGPYIRYAAISSTGDEAFANAYLALPGVGLQIYPFSFQFSGVDSWAQSILGPLRLFGEYNWVHYRGDENSWRPDYNIRAGGEYWRARGVNELTKAVWHELWLGGIWQSANEFDDEYDTLVWAGTIRLGIRIPGQGFISQLTPYGAASATKTDNDTYYWENRWEAGGGVRWTPPKRWFEKIGIQQALLFAEYLRVIDYFNQEAPSSVPDSDWRIGINVSLGKWFR